MHLNSACRMCERYCLADVEFLHERRSCRRLGGRGNGVMMSVEPPNKIICWMGPGNLSNECLDELVFVEWARESCVAWDKACTEDESSCNACVDG